MYYHIKVMDLRLNIHYIKCMSWEIVEKEILMSTVRQITVIEVKDSEGNICPH